MCPERTLEGKALQELRELPQIIGADSPEVADRAAALFRRLTFDGSGRGYRDAEIIKLVSNTFRDVESPSPTSCTPQPYGDGVLTIYANGGHREIYHREHRGVPANKLM